MTTDDPRRGTPAARIEHTFHAVAASGALWLWGDEDDTLVMEDDAGGAALAVWPDEATARQECEADADVEEEPIRVPVDRFLKVHLPRLERAGERIAVFPVDGTHAGTLTPAEFRTAIAAARRTG